VRSRRLEHDWDALISSFSSADGHGALEFKSGASHIDFSITASERANSMAKTWNDQYDKETCLNFFTYLLHFGLKETVKSCLDDNKPQLPGKDQRTGELAEFFMKNFSPDETRVSIPIVAESVRYAGATASKKYLPLIEKIDKQLNRYSIPGTRTAKQVYDEIRALEDKKQGPKKEVVKKKIKALREEYNRVEVGSSAPVALDRLREAIRQAKKKIALARRGRIEYFFKIKEWFDKADSFSEKGNLLLTLTYLALQGKGKYLTELERLLGRYIRKTNIKIGEVIRSEWAADFKQFKDRLAEIATSGPEDYEDRAAYTSGPDKDVDGRYHMARKVCALWNEQGR
jgi:hypothetical protein